MVEEIRKHRKAGRPSSDKTPLRTELARLYIRERKSIRDVAETLNCSKDMVSRALKAYGIEARTRARRSGLEKYDRKALESAAKVSGIRGTAKELGVNPSTLSRFLRSKVGN
jgi:predicted transcriptional regulator